MINMMTDCTLKQNIDPYMAATLRSRFPDWLDTWIISQHFLTESMKVKPVIAAATLSQNTAVDETALAAPSQNITAYVVNTELSQNQSR